MLFHGVLQGQIRELSFFSSRGGGGGLVETGGSSKYNRLKRGNQEKIMS